MDLGVPGGLPFRLRTAERLLPGGSACRSRADGGQRAHGDGNDRRWGVRAAVRGVSDGFVSHGNGVDGWAHVRGRRHARVPVLVCDGSFPIEIGRVAGFGGYGGAFGFDRIIDDVRAGLHGWDGACLENPRSDVPAQSPARPCETGQGVEGRGGRLVEHAPPIPSLTYDHHDADGFITLFGLPLKVRAMKLLEVEKNKNNK